MNDYLATVRGFVFGENQIFFRRIDGLWGCQAPLAPRVFVGVGGGYFRDYARPDKIHPDAYISINEASLHAGTKSISLCILIAVGFGFRGLDDAGHVSSNLNTSAAQ